MTALSEHAVAHRKDAFRDLLLALASAVAAYPFYLALNSGSVEGLWILLPILGLLFTSMAAFCLVLMAVATDAAYRLARRHSPPLKP